MTTLKVMGMKTYVPAENFEESKQFYRDLGFQLTEVWGKNFDCRLGDAEFRLQNYYVKEWAENVMLQFDVEDARAWYLHVKPIVDSGRYPKTRVSEPEDAGDCVITHVWDPCGVLLIFVQSP